MARKNGIPVHRAYSCGIKSTAYELGGIVEAFGAANTMLMVEMLAAGRKKEVDQMLRKWTLHMWGDQYAMIDHMCNTDTKYGLTARTAAAKGAGV